MGIRAAFFAWPNGDGFAALALLKRAAVATQAAIREALNFRLGGLIAVNPGHCEIHHNSTKSCRNNDFQDCRGVQAKSLTEQRRIVGWMRLQARFRAHQRRPRLHVWQHVARFRRP